MFQIHDVVVYENNGVYEVTDIGPLSFSENTDKQYYTLHSKFTKGSSLVYVPVDSTRYMRKIMNQTDAEEIIHKIPQIHASSMQFSKNQALKDHYLEVMKTHDIWKYLVTLKEIAWKESNAKNHRKRLGQIDTQYKERLLTIISQEFATVFSTDLNYALERLQEDIEIDIQTAG